VVGASPRVTAGSRRDRRSINTALVVVEPQSVARMERMGGLGNHDGFPAGAARSRGIGAGFDQAGERLERVTPRDQRRPPG